MNSKTEENYLKAIFHLVNSENEFTVNELSKNLNIKMPSINSMMKKFSEKEWVVHESYKPLILTEKGRKIAALVVRKHRLTEMFLVEKMHFGWEKVHSIAEQIEHIQSEDFFDKMDELLDFPKTDPHGSPIPDKNGVMPNFNRLLLSEAQVGQRLKLCGVLHSNDDFLVYLNKYDFLLGNELIVKYIEKFDQSMSVKMNSKTMCLSALVCQKLWVEIL